ncbi:MAG TPA: Crp/Fnr family transcriptional regulator, partial [Turneriella sp.]|nr:Crp/Fnr family transcriptional regulator [Turneriella sp.]
QFWQDREGNDRMSRGRLIAPIMATADLQMMLLRAIGTYRWEICKTTMGPDWNNISVSSLTADYTDYVQFFYKSKELSEEIKEKIAEDMKRFRDDRARFVNDYTVYMRFESEGSQRMNRVARKIFTKHIPFAKEIRERLLKLPSYTEVVQKSINIRKKKANELTPRYTKYERENKTLPKELVETRRYYNMEY